VGSESLGRLGSALGENRRNDSCRSLSAARLESPPLGDSPMRGVGNRNRSRKLHSIQFINKNRLSGKSTGLVNPIKNCDLRIRVVLIGKTPGLVGFTKLCDLRPFDHCKIRTRNFTKCDRFLRREQIIVKNDLLWLAIPNKTPFWAINNSYIAGERPGHCPSWHRNDRSRAEFGVFRKMHRKKKITGGRRKDRPVPIRRGEIETRYLVREIR
jgi:hypothetical protein